MSDVPRSAAAAASVAQELRVMYDALRRQRFEPNEAIHLLVAMIRSEGPRET